MKTDGEQTDPAGSGFLDGLGVCPRYFRAGGGKPLTLCGNHAGSLHT